MTEVIATQTPPLLHKPSDKERKYDRQLRLWAASGQAALESANILLVSSGAGVVGVETLKNLVLPGIGRFAIYDDEKVNAADLGVNFFVDESYLGKPRARALTELLLELNPEVQGDWYPNGEVKSLEPLISNDEAPAFTVIMYTYPIKPEYLSLLESYSQKHKTPLVAIHCAGFYSYFQINLPGPFPIVDTHPDETATTDLRVLAPWPELITFAEELTKDIDNQSDHEHGHLPYVVILLHYLEKWKTHHDGKVPSTYKEKTEFRSIIQAATRTTNAEGGEENFDEAVAAVLKTLVAPSLPSGLKEVFDYEHTDPDEQKSDFWIIADAVKKFYEEHKCLPLPGKVPDMKAQSEVYIKLQTIYKTKARKDAAEILETVRATPGGDKVDPAEVDLFCKNAAFVKLINATGGGKISSKADRLKEVYVYHSPHTAQEVANDEMAEMTLQPLSLFPIYLALQPTSHRVDLNSPPIKAEKILEEVAKLVSDADKNEKVIDAAGEVARAEGGELHNVSALVGGMVAQELIKIITKQYIPIDNTCVYDGINSRTQVLRL
ncbi:putative NEDD8-activating enzyme E1 regulatory subunit [Podospora fimiseda]|uniref:NEDD8-activating enzyme E1 regulatory subunit n=1 Tax=Podospora fimiseda TaxID=252190 RepID=A0AAN7BV55_9PEZI|nr:putative NEDD8-activating enzyme E1 regulatory subunit [Podospora fimiseda]